MNVFKHLKTNVDSSELFRIAKSLHDNYQPFMLDCQVWDLLQNVIPTQFFIEYVLPYKKETVGHKILNDIVMNGYFGERKVKYHLSLKYLNRLNEVSVFEFNVGASRLDFARLNGSSYAYEIKTELDSLDKLEKQITDYSEVFEYIHVVCHPDHYYKVLSKVPEYCGVITYNSLREGFPFYFKRKRLLNPDIDANAQLSTLTTKELDRIIKTEGFKEIPSDRKIKESLLVEKVSSQKINHHFKETIKKRFFRRWNFVCANIDSIEPIDLQSFYNSTADPYWVYYKNSSMV